MIQSRGKWLATGLKLLLLLSAMGIAGVSSYALVEPQLQSPVLQRLLSNITLAGYSHVIFGSAALILGGLQMSSKIRRNYLSLHKFLGNAYVASVLISTCGSIGHLLATPLPFVLASAFWTLAIAWPITTLLGYPFGKGFNFRRHGKFMIYSYAMTCAAISLRIWLLILMLSGIGFQTAYPIAAWAGSVGNVLLTFAIMRFVESRRTTASTKPPAIEKAMSH